MWKPKKNWTLRVLAGGMGRCRFSFAVAVLLPILLIRSDAAEHFGCVDVLMTVNGNDVLVPHIHVSYSNWKTSVLSFSHITFCVYVCCKWLGCLWLCVMPTLCPRVNASVGVYIAILLCIE